MAELEADTVVILSSELISKIVGEYFNKKMFREKVEIVDLKPAEAGYMFSIAFSAKRASYPIDPIDPIRESSSSGKGIARGSNGKFTKVESK